MGIIACLILIIVVIAVLGFLGHKAADAGVDGVFWSALHALATSAVLMLMILANFVLAKTGIERLFGKGERYLVKGDGADMIGHTLFGRGVTDMAPLLAIVLVLASVAAAAKLHRSIRTVIAGLHARQHVLEYVGAIAWIPMCMAVLALDTYVLVLRLATMLNPGMMENGFDRLSGLGELSGGSSAAHEILRVFMFGYPCLIVLVESTFSSAWAKFLSEARGFPAQRPAVVQHAQAVPAPEAAPAPEPQAAPAPEAQAGPAPDMPAAPGRNGHVPAEDIDQFIGGVPPAR